MNQAWTRYLPSFLRKRLEGRHALQQAVGNAGWLMADQAVRMVVGLLVGVWVARYLGPETYGTLSYALAFGMLFGPIATLGLDSIVNRKIVLDPSCDAEAIGTSFYLSLLGALASIGLSLAGIYLLRPTDGLSHVLVGIIVAASIPQAFVAIEYWFESQVQARYIVVAKLTGFAVANVAKVYLIVTGAAVVWFAWAVLFEAVLSSFFLIVAYQSSGRRISRWKFSKKMAGELLRDGWPLFLSALLSMFSMRIDQVMLGEMTNAKEVGIYSAAVRLAEPWFYVSFAVCISVFPGLMKSWATDRELFHKQLQILYNWMAVIGYAVAVPISLFSGPLIKACFGAAYEGAGPLLAVLVWAGLFTSLSSARTMFMVSMNWTRLFLVTLIIGAALNVGLNYVLIPQYGAMGAVVASLIAYWAGVHGVCFLFKPLRRTGFMLLRAMLYPKVW